MCQERFIYLMEELISIPRVFKISLPVTVIYQNEINLPDLRSRERDTGREKIENGKKNIIVIFLFEWVS